MKRKFKAHRLAIGLGQSFREGLKGVKVKPLVDRVELATAGLHHLLRHNSSKDSGHGGDITPGLVSEHLDDLLIQVCLMTLLCLHSACKGKHFCRISLVPRARGSAVLLLEEIQGLESNVELHRALELGKVGEQELPRVGQGLLQGFL